MSKLQESQRALVLQGGGSLGAYEAGVYQALYERLTKRDKEKGISNRPFLHIVAGYSGPENVGSRNSFSAIGQISSLVITVPNSDFNISSAFKVILTGEWNLSVRNGSVTNFDVNFLASPMDGMGIHIHQISNFKPYEMNLIYACILRQ